MAKDDATDGNTRQWDKLKAARGEPVEKPPVEGTPVLIKGVDRDETTGKFVSKKEDVPVVTEQAEVVEQAAPVEAAPVDTTPKGEEVDIDGVKVMLDPALAAAFKKAEEVKTQTAKLSEREALKAELLAELKQGQPPQRPQADIEAEIALKAAEEAERNLPPAPNDDLLIADPATWRQMRDARDAGKEKLLADRVRAETKREIMAQVAKQQEAAVQDADVRARGILREQFYAVYPTLKDSADLVDPLLDVQFNAVVSSGKLRPNMTPAEGEQLKASEFADVASKAARRLVKLKGAANKVVVTPPTLASSQPTKAPAPKVEKPTEPKQKYPEGSMSRLLKKHQEAKAGAAS